MKVSDFDTLMKTLAERMCGFEFFKTINCRGRFCMVKQSLKVVKNIVIKPFDHITLPAIGNFRNLLYTTIVAVRLIYRKFPSAGNVL
eukprot:UN16535